VNRSRGRTGALVGIVLTAPMAAVFYLAWKLAGLSFVPFDAFDWVARTLPGSLITFGIDVMVQMIRALHLGRTSDVAKSLEQFLALAAFCIAGAVAGAVLFAIWRACKKTVLPWGILSGAVAGSAAWLIGVDLGRTALHPFAEGLWIVGSFSVWGALLGWAYDRLCARLPAEVSVASAEGAFARVVDRRHFLIRLSGASAAITVAGAVIGELTPQGRAISEIKPWSATHLLPNAGDPVRPVAGTRPEVTALKDHYRVDINAVSPSIDEKIWRLKLAGLVERPRELTIDQIRTYEPMNQFVTLSCISNPVGGDLISTTLWTGVSLKRLLPDVGLLPRATHLRIRSADGFYETVSLNTINTDERVMLTYAWDDLPLWAGHGFPLRIYVPDVYGMKQPKWIESIEAIDHFEEGFWVARGWDRRAQMKATSVIDVIAADAAFVNSQGQKLVPVGGIAHAGARGISKVELRSDDREWQQAELRHPLSDTTWVIWRYDWPFEAGEHVLTVRCTDGNGIPQIVQSSSPYPVGATGLNTRTSHL
jgi:DMSO/TMAO reductase YedYZ molybdopterin-dependent catalytic subunit